MQIQVLGYIYSGLGSRAPLAGVTCTHSTGHVITKSKQSGKRACHDKEKPTGRDTLPFRWKNDGRRRGRERERERERESVCVMVDGVGGRVEGW